MMSNFYSIALHRPSELIFIVIHLSTRSFRVNSLGISISMMHMQKAFFFLVFIWVFTLPSFLFLSKEEIMIDHGHVI